MNHSTARALLAASISGLLSLACAGDLSSPGAEHAPAPGAQLVEQPAAPIIKHPEGAVCGEVGPGRRRCHARVRLTDDGKRPLVVPSLQPFATAPTNMGFLPTDLISAYNLGSVPAGSGTVAIVDAYDYANAESDLAAYRTQTGLPACTTANGCFTKVDQSGGTPDPACAGGDQQGCWADEMMLDLDMVSAICPACKILLVEAPSDQGNDLNTGVNYAVLHADAVSNSYGGSEDSSITSDTTFKVTNVLITASAGDSGYGAEYPATSPYVLAVGGTNLVKDSSTRGWTETAWTGTPSSQNGATGAGCSAYIAKPSYQTGACAKRMESDVSAVADPQTGVAVYDSNYGGWTEVGGTSAASPLIAAMFTRLGLAKTAAQQAGAWPAAHTSAFYDVTSGSDDSVGQDGCSSSYECVAQVGYDGPTGYGTPNGAALLAAGGGSISANDWTLSLNPTASSVSPGGQTTFSVLTSLASGTAEAISLSVSGLPSGVTGSFSPSQPTAGQSSTLTLTAASNAPNAAATTFTVKGTSTSQTAGHSATGTVAVTSPPTVNLVAPANNSAVSGAVSLSATATAASGTSLASLVLNISGSQVASGTASVSYSWDTSQVGPGANTITAVATDADGGTASAQVTLDVVLAPTATVNSPSSGAQLSGMVSISISGAPASGATLASLALDIDGVQAALGNGQSTLTITADTSQFSNGSHQLTAVARDTDGASGTSPVVTVTFKNPPRVSITSPVAAANVSGTVVVQVSASEQGGSISKVAFEVDGVEVTTLTAAPYSFSWATGSVANGSHALTAVATDATGQSGTSAAVSVVVSNSSGCSSTGASGWELLAALGLIALARSRRSPRLA